MSLYIILMALINYKTYVNYNISVIIYIYMVFSNENNLPHSNANEIMILNNPEKIGNGGFPCSSINEEIYHNLPGKYDIL